MSRVHQCVRNFSRENLNYTEWSKFFAKNGTPFIFLDKQDGSDVSNMNNIVGYVSNVELKSSGFSYTMHHITEQIDEDNFLNGYTLEPIIAQTVLKGEILNAEILCLVMVPMNS